MANPYNDGPEKQHARELVIKHFGGKKAKCALFLPGPEQTCMKMAMKAGVIDRDTYVITIEKDEETADKIDGFLKKNFNRYCPPFCLSADKFKLLNMKNIPPIDLAFADFCGLLSTELFIWIREELARKCSQGARLAFTFTTLDRREEKKRDSFPEILRKSRNYQSGSLEWKEMDRLLDEATGVGPYFYFTIHGIRAALPLPPRSSINGAKPYKGKRFPMMLILATIEKQDASSVAKTGDEYWRNLIQANKKR